MSAEIEAVGDLMTGAAVARAVEPGHGEPAGIAPRCLNCGAALAGAYCQVCGQKAQVHRTIGAFWHDFTHSILHFEGKIWRTLPLLVFRPGELTRRYVHGERARFVSPLALFLFFVFLMFAVFGTIGGPFAGTADVAAMQRDLAQETRSLANRIETLERQRRELAAAGRPTAALDERLADARQELRNVESIRPIVLAPNAAPQGTSTTVNLRETRIDTGWPRLDRAFTKARDNPQLLLYKMQSNAYKFSWALVLLSLPFVWLAFAWKRTFHVFDHLVFITYSLCFMTLLLVTGSLLTAVGLSGPVMWLLALAPPVHIFAQLRGAYGLTRLGALWRTLYLLAAAGVVLLVFGLFLLGTGI